MRKNFLMVLLVCMGAFGINFANADEQDKTFYFAPALTYIIADEDRKSDDGYGLSLGFGKIINNSVNFEVSAVLDTMARDSDGDYEQYGLLLDYLFFVNRNKSFSPYALIGGGALHTKIPNENTTSPMGNVGAGFMTRLMNNGLSLRADARYRIDADNESMPGEKRFGDWIFNIGLTIPFGSTATPTNVDEDNDGVNDVIDDCLNTPMGASVGANGCETDSDGDGVPDSIDQCSGTTGNVKIDRNGCEADSDGDGIVDSLDQCDGTVAGSEVDANGCAVQTDTDADGDGIGDSVDQCDATPENAVVDANGCEVDTDGDGIADSMDQCADTIAGASVGANGCEFDTDGDGIADSVDQCADTVAGASVGANGCEFDTDGDGIADSQDNCADTVAGTKVDINGCKIPDIIVLQGVNFESGSTLLTADSMTNLNDVAATLIRNPEMVVEIAGYTDNRGAESFNRSLSQKRANSVREYLIQQGVASESLVAKGYGPDKPIADNSTTEGRSQNRRVEMQVIKR